MESPAAIVDLVLAAQGAGRWEEVLRWTHPGAVARIAQKQIRALRAALGPAPQLPGVDVHVEAACRNALRRAWKIEDADELDALGYDEVFLRGLAIARANDFRAEVPAPGSPRATGTVMESDTVAHVVVRRRTRVEYTWWGHGSGWPLVVTTLLTPDGWRVYAEPDLHARIAEMIASGPTIRPIPPAEIPRVPPAAAAA